MELLVAAGSPFQLSVDSWTGTHTLTHTHTPLHFGSSPFKQTLFSSPPLVLLTPHPHHHTQTPSSLTPPSPACDSASSVPLLLPDVTPPLPVAPGSGCQTRTLDSGIGTFPLPDSVTRSSARHIPKSESSPDRVTADSASSHPDPSQSDVKMPSLPQPRLHDPPSMGHSQSESSVTSSQQDRDVQKRPPTCSGTPHSCHLCDAAV